MANRIFKIVILGAPGSGKGSISSRIINNFPISHISSGDKLRLNVQNQTALGLEAKKFIDQGKLVPDEYMIKFILNEIKQVGNKSWLLDGFPRTTNQAKLLWQKQPSDIVLNLCVPFHIIIDRVKKRWIHLPSGRVYNIDFNAPKVPSKDDVTGEPLVQRDDDREEVVQKRLQDYENMTRPVIDFYRNLGILHDFQGEATNEIWPKVFKCLAAEVPLRNDKISAAA